MRRRPLAHARLAPSSVALIALVALAEARCGNDAAHDSPAVIAEPDRDAASPIDAASPPALDASRPDAPDALDASPETSVADAAPPSTVWHERADRALRQMLLTYFTDGSL